MGAPLEFDVRLHMEQLQKDITAVNRKIDEFVQNTKKGAGEIDDQFRKVAGLVAGYFSLNFAANMVKQIALVRGEFQQLEVAFRTMLGNKAQADALMQEVVQFAAITPFELKDVASGAKSLLAFGVAAEDVLPTLKSLGDVSAGLSVPIERLILNFGQVKTQAKLTGRELRDFNVAGVPIIAELAKNLGVAEKEIASMVEAGNIGFEDVAKAFKTMTDEGGRFANLMQEQSKTITGQISNLKDAWAQMLNEVGKSNEGAISGALSVAKGLIENYEKVISVLKTLVVTYGAYKAAVILVNLVLKEQAAITALVAASEGTLTRQMAAQQMWTLRLQKSQALLNKTMLNNPFVLAAMGIALLLKATANLGKNIKSTQEYIDDLNDSIETIGDQVETDRLIAKYQELNKETNRTKEQQEELSDTINKLGGKFPEVVREVDAYGKVVRIAADELAKLNEEIRKNTIELTKVELDKSEQQLDALVRQREELQRQINSGYTETQDEYGITTIVQLSEKAIIKLRKDASALTKEIGDLSNEILKSRGAMSELGKPEVSEILKPYENLFIDVRRLTDKEARDIKAKLVQLFAKNLGEGAEETIKNQISAIDEYLKQPVNSDSVSQIRAKLKVANEELAALLAGGAKSTDEERDKAREKVKELEDQLLSFGINVKASAKAANKAAEERIKAQQELSDRLIELESQTQAAQIAIMQDGTAKQIAESRLQRDLELQEIEKSRKQIAETLKNSGLVQGTEAYGVQEALFNEQLNKQAEIARQAHLNRIENIEAASAEKIMQIRAQITEAFLSNQHREEAAVNDKWNRILTDLQSTEGATAGDFMGVMQSWNTELSKIATNYKLQRIDSEQEIATITEQLQQDRFESEAKHLKRLLKIEIEYNNKRIEELEKTGEEADKVEAERLRAMNSLLEKSLNELATEAALDLFDKIGNKIREIIPILREADAIGESFAEGLENSLSMFLDIGKSIKEKDWLGLAFTVIQSLISDIFDTFQPEKIGETFERLRDELRDTLNIINEVSRALDNMGGDGFVSTANMMREQLYLLDRSAKELNDATKDVSLNPKLFDMLYLLDFRSTYEIIGSLRDQIKSLTEKLVSGNLTETQTQAILAEIESYNAMIDAIESSINQLTGTSANELADALVDAFLSGEDAAERWGETVDDVIQNIIRKQLVAQLLYKPIEQAMVQLSDMAKDGLDQNEILYFKTTLQSLFTKIGPAFQDAMQALKDVGIDLSSITEASGSEGYANAIRGITEETAGIIAGQFYAMRENLKNVYITGMDQLDVANNSLSHLSNIDNNTLLSYIKIAELYEETKRMHASIKAL